MWHPKPEELDAPAGNRRHRKRQCQGDHPRIVVTADSISNSIRFLHGLYISRDAWWKFVRWGIFGRHSNCQTFCLRWQASCHPSRMRIGKPTVQLRSTINPKFFLSHACGRIRGALPPVPGQLLLGSFYCVYRLMPYISLTPTWVWTTTAMEIVIVSHTNPREELPFKEGFAWCGAFARSLPELRT